MTAPGYRELAERLRDAASARRCMDGEAYAAGLFDEAAAALTTQEEEIERLRAREPTIVTIPLDGVIMGHCEDPRAEVRDSETGEVIFPAIKGPLRIVKGGKPDPQPLPEGDGT